MNSWNLTGRLPRDAETKYDSKGDPIVTFSVAVDVGYGQNKSTLWPRCVFFGKRGGAVAQYLVKGQLVGVSGELTKDHYVNSEGTKVPSLEIRVLNVDLLGKAEGRSQDGTPPNPAPQKQSSGAPDHMDDDIPFASINNKLAMVS